MKKVFETMLKDMRRRNDKNALIDEKTCFSHFSININSLIIFRYQKITYDFWKLIYLETFVSHMIQI
jgi:hypothetical protein